MDPKPKQSSSLLASATKVLMGGCVAFLMLLFTEVLLEGGYSHSEAFQSIHVGMPEDEASTRLENEGVVCEVAPHVQGSQRERECWFRDYWRQYLIVTDPEKHIVILRQVWLRKPYRNIANRAATRMASRPDKSK